FAEIYETVEDMDSAIQILADQLESFNPKSMKGLKEIMLYGTDHWDELLIKRAEISGERVLSEFTRKTIEKLKKD
ncbi:MAG: enoyl-CoA hydratase/isomerase family protein, partial [Candidatus Marinimicrobia bacterium]|nr:enoyl-CoA hydratase/isomerase family protein [Candidatus Neomarinimicrobiota bacterium]